MAYNSTTTSGFGVLKSVLNISCLFRILIHFFTCTLTVGVFIRMKSKSKSKPTSAPVFPYQRFFSEEVGVLMGTNYNFKVLSEIRGFYDINTDRQTTIFKGNCCVLNSDEGKKFSIKSSELYFVVKCSNLLICYLNNHPEVLWKLPDTQGLNECAGACVFQVFFVQWAQVAKTCLTHFSAEWRLVSRVPQGGYNEDCKYPKFAAFYRKS